MTTKKNAGAAKCADCDEICLHDAGDACELMMIPPRCPFNGRFVRIKED